MSHMRICMLCETYVPVAGGAESQARLLAERLSTRGHSVMMVTRRTSADLDRRERIGPVEVFRVGPAGGGGSRRWPMIATAGATLTALRHEYDVLLVLGFRALGILAPLVRALRRPVILKAESVGEMSGEFFEPRLRRIGLSGSSLPIRIFLRFRAAAFGSAGAFVAISSAIADEMRVNGAREDRICMIPNAVDTALFRPVPSVERDGLRRDLGVEPHHLLVTYTGRLVSYKGLPMLLRVWERVAAQQPHARLLLVGGGSGDIDNCEAELHAFVRDRQLGASVRFMGQVAAVHRFLQASDVFVLPTENEAFGLALVEAMACALPCIACSTGGVPDVLTDGRDGVLIGPRNEPALERALHQLLSSPADRRRLGESARRAVVERFEAEAVTDAYAALFEKLVTH